jgi:1,2-diacylglycerol 3-alpha-glucosyltransferase
MNVGVFTDCYLPTKNGVTTAIVQVRQELERRGHKVVVCTVANPGTVERDLGVYRFPSLPFNAGIELRLGLARQGVIDRIVKREKLDLIHTHTEFSLGWSGKRAARCAGLPLIHTLHTFYPAYRHYLPLGRLLPERAIGRLLARILAGYDAVVCPSEKGRAYLVSCMSTIRTAVIGNGVSQKRFNPERVTQADRDRARAALGIEPEDRIILYVGRLAQEKRVLALLAALQPLLAADARSRVVFVGTGPARDGLAAAARAAGLDPQVLLTGPVPWERMVELYAIAHVFATASLSEIHPMTLIEAAMCGLPIVARRDVSFVGLVRDGYNGFLVDSDRGIAGKLWEILQDETKQRAFAHNALSLSGQFTIEAHADKLEALYRQVTTRTQESFQ